MSSLQLGYHDFEQLTRDAYGSSLLIEICEKFLEQDITEEAKLYANAKLARQQAILGNEPNVNSINAYQELVELAKRNGNTPLQSLAIVHAECNSDFAPLPNDRARKFSEALGIILGVNFPDLDSAIEAAETTHIVADAPSLIPFVASAVGIANEFTETDLDKGYDIFANIIKLAPDIMYPKIFASYNRLNKYIRDNDETALEHANALMDEVIQFATTQPTDSTTQPTENETLPDYRLRKREAIRGFVLELYEALKRKGSRLELASLLEQPTRFAAAAEVTLNRYRKSITDSKARLQ